MIPAQERQLVEQVTAIYEKEQLNPTKVCKRSEVPIHYECITAEWLTDVLCNVHAGAEVTGFRLDKSDDGTTNRRRIFVEYNETGQTSGLPASVFCKSSQGLVNRITSAIVKTGAIETTFYNKVRPQIAIEAPRTYLANNDPQTYNSIIMLHDLGDSANFCTEKTYIDFDHAVGMVTLLANLHATFYENSKLETIRNIMPTWEKHWGDILRLGMEEYSNKGFLAAEPEIPARLYRRFKEIWPTTMKAVAAHRSLPQTLAHGDVHPKNWYITNEGNMGLSDWQGPCVSNWSRDFAYATSAALTVEDRRNWQEKLLKIYLETLREKGVADAPSFDNALVLMRQQLFTALAYWTVTLRNPPTMPDDMQPEDTARTIIERLATTIDDYDALDSFGGE